MENLIRPKGMNRNMNLAWKMFQSYHLRQWRIGLVSSNVVVLKFNKFYTSAYFAFVLTGHRHRRQHGKRHVRRYHPDKRWRGPP